MTTSGTQQWKMTIRGRILAGFVVVLLIMLTLGLTAIVNLNDIRARFDGLLEATQVERYAYKTIQEEKNYLLDEKAESHQQAMKNIDTIIAALDKIDASSSDESLLERSRNARAATEKYRQGYEAGVAALQANAEAVRRMAENAATVVRLADEYYKQTQDEVALKVYITALEIVNDERAERLYQDRKHYARMLEKRKELEGHYDVLDPQKRDARVNQAREATDAFFQAAADWIENDDVLKKEILPRMHELGGEVIRLAYDAAQDASSQMISTQNLSNSVIGIGVVIAIVLGTLIAVVLSNMISRPLIYAVNFAKSVAQGDLTQQVEGQYLQRSDEIGDLAHALDEMITQLRAIVRRVVDGAEAVDASANQIAQSSTDLNQLTDEQLSALSQMAAAMEEMSATVDEVATSAQQASQASREGRHETEKGSGIVQGVASTIQQHADEIKTTSAKITELARASEEIAQVISTIQSIAEQTNLLALNAAIEAARAGENGRGFAVVADEVRTLASRTQSSTEEIRNTIQRLQAMTNDAVQVMTASQGLAEKSVTSAHQGLAALQNISAQIGQVEGMNQQIASTTEQQSRTTAELSHNTLRIKELADSVAKGAGRTAGDSQAIKGLAEELKRVTNRFNY